MNRHLHQCLIVLFCLSFTSLLSYGQTRPKIVIGFASMSSVATTLWVTQKKGFFSILRELDKSGFIDQVYAAKPVPR